MVEYNDSPIVGLDKSLNNLFVRREKLRRLLDNVDKNIAEVRTNIAKLNSNKDKDKLKASEHAIERFKERIWDLPKQKVVKLLCSDDLFNRFKEYGPGKFRLSSYYPNVIIVIKDFTIITCYDQFDPIERINITKAWLDRWIEERVSQELGEDIHPLRLKTFRKTYYK